MPRHRNAALVLAGVVALACAALAVLLIGDSPPTPELLQITTAQGQKLAITGPLKGCCLLPVSGVVEGRVVHGYIRITRGKPAPKTVEIAPPAAPPAPKPKLTGKPVGFPYYGPMHLRATVTGTTLDGHQIEAGDRQTAYLLGTLLKRYGNKNGFTLDGTLGALKHDDDDASGQGTISVQSRGQSLSQVPSPYQGQSLSQLPAQGGQSQAGQQPDVAQALQGLESKVDGLSNEVNSMHSVFARVKKLLSFRHDY